MFSKIHKKTEVLIIRMGYKEVFTTCDDCMNYDIFEESRNIHTRHCIYFCSSLMTTGLVMSLFYWTWIIMSDMDNEID